MLADHFQYQVTVFIPDVSALLHKARQVNHDSLTSGVPISAERWAIQWITMAYDNTQEPVYLVMLHLALQTCERREVGSV